MVDEIVIGFEDAHELPDVFHRAELGAFRRQGDDGDVGRNDKPRRNVPAGLSGQEHGVSASRDGRGRLRRDAGSSPRWCRRPGSGLRTCPARGRRHRRCRSRRCADRAERWGEIRAWLPLLHFAESGRQLSAREPYRSDQSMHARFPAVEGTLGSICAGRGEARIEPCRRLRERSRARGRSQKCRRCFRSRTHCNRNRTTFTVLSSGSAAI
jgi:hypothetical protein